MSQPLLIPIFWDVDLTITKRYQQVPLFAKYKEKLAQKLKAHGYTYKSEESYFDIVNDRKDSDAGIAYLQEIVWDAQIGGPFAGLTTDELFDLGKEIEPATGFIECLNELKKRFEGEAVLHHYFVSVGMRDMILGFIEANKLSQHVFGVAASEFYTNEKHQITGIRRVVSPFTKNEWIIGFMKGDQRLLNMQLKSNEYKYKYENMIVVGDGQTDTSKFAYSKKKGGTPCAVYEPKNEKALDKAKKTVGLWVDYLMPRDYTPNSVTYKLLVQAIERKIKRKCTFRPNSLHDYKKGAITHPDEERMIKDHINSCSECQQYFCKYLVPLNNQIEETCIIKLPKEQEKLYNYFSE